MRTMLPMTGTVSASGTPPSSRLARQEAWKSTISDAQQAPQVPHTSRASGTGRPAALLVLLAAAAGAQFVAAGRRTRAHRRIQRQRHRLSQFQVHPARADLDDGIARLGQ